MAEKNLQGLRVAILATDLFEEAELIEPRKALDAAGAKTEVISPKAGEIQAVQHDKKTQKVKVDRTLDSVHADEFDAILLPGGAMNATRCAWSERRRNSCVTPVKRTSRLR